jgi:hypothetical protein
VVDFPGRESAVHPGTLTAESSDDNQSLQLKKNMQAGQVKEKDKTPISSICFGDTGGRQRFVCVRNEKKSNNSIVEFRWTTICWNSSFPQCANAVFVKTPYLVIADRVNVVLIVAISRECSGGWNVTVETAAAGS